MAKQLVQSGKQDKVFTSPIMIFTCPGQVLSYTSGQMILLVNLEAQTLQLNGLILKLIGKCHLEDYIVPKQSINTVPNPGSLYIVYMENPSLALATFWVN